MMFRMSIKNAKAINLPAENTVVHAVRQHFLVDGHDGITNPVGMLGARLEVDMHVVHGNTNRLQNSVRLVKGLQLEVEEIVFNGLASSLALLTSEQKELGALVIDIGGGTTDYVVYADGVIKHTGVLALGGDHVSNDLGHGLKVPLSRAEKLKLEHGSALVDEAMKGRTLTITNELGLPLKTINVEHLQRIMSLRLEEIFQIIASDLENAGLDGLSARGNFSLRRLRACAADREARRANFPDAGFARPDQFHQRPEIRARPAGICHGNRPGKIRLAQNAQARRQIVLRARNQKHPHQFFAPIKIDPP